MLDGKDEANGVDSPDPALILNHGSSDDSIPQPHLQQGPLSDHHPPGQTNPSPQNASIPLPPKPPVFVPTIRLPSCTHSVVERQFCVDPRERCESCGRIPFLGWFFVCVEDTSGFSDPLDPIRGPFLSPWILKAIETGQYTVEERELLIHQKLHVLRMADLERAPSSPSLSMLEAEYGAGEPAVQQTAQTNLSHASPGGPTANLFPHALPPLPPLPCLLRACRHCERRHGNLEERAWSSINEVCNDPSIGPPAAFELAGRPVSDARIVRNLGWRSAAVAGPRIVTIEDHAEDSEEAWDNAFNSPIDLTAHGLSGLVNRALDIAEIDVNESSLTILVGVELDDSDTRGGASPR